MVLSPEVQSLILLSLSIGGIYVLISVGLSLIFGVMRIVNFAHGSLVMGGGYISLYVLNEFGINPMASLIVVIPILFVLGYLTQRVFLERVTHDLEMNSLLLTFGLAIIGEALLTEIFGNSPRFIQFLGSSYKIVEASITLNKIVAGIVGYIAAGALFLFLSRSEIGQAIRATAQVPELAEACGINSLRIRCLTFGIASVLAGVAGSMYLISYSVSPIGGRLLLLLGFVIITLGGLGDLPGAVIAAVMVAALQIFAGYYISASAAFFFLFTGVVVLLLLRPAGIRGKGEVEV